MCEGRRKLCGSSQLTERLGSQDKHEASQRAKGATYILEQGSDRSIFTLPDPLREVAKTPKVNQRPQRI